MEYENDMVDDAEPGVAGMPVVLLGGLRSSGLSCLPFFASAKTCLEKYL